MSKMGRPVVGWGEMAEDISARRAESRSGEERMWIRAQVATGVVLALELGRRGVNVGREKGWDGVKVRGTHAMMPTTPSRPPHVRG